MRDSWHFPALRQTTNRLRRSFSPIKKKKKRGLQRASHAESFIRQYKFDLRHNSRGGEMDVYFINEKSTSGAESPSCNFFFFFFSETAS